MIQQGKLTSHEDMLKEFKSPDTKNNKGNQ